MGWTLFYDTGDYYYNFIYIAEKLLLQSILLWEVRLLFITSEELHYFFLGIFIKKIILKLLITYLMNLKIPIGSLKTPGLSHIFISLFFTNYIFIFYSSFSL